MSSAQALASKAPDTTLARLNRLLTSPRSQGTAPREASPSPTRYLKAYAYPHSPAPHQGAASVPPGTAITLVPARGGSKEADSALHGPNAVSGTGEDVQGTGHVTRGDLGRPGLPLNGGLGPSGDLRGPDIPPVPLGVVATPCESSGAIEQPSLPGEATEGSAPGPALVTPDSHNLHLRGVDGCAKGEKNVRGGLQRRRYPRRVLEEERAEKFHQDGATSELRIEPIPPQRESDAHPLHHSASAQGRPDTTQPCGRIQNPLRADGAAGAGRAKRRREEDAAQAAAEREHAKWLQDLRELASDKHAVPGCARVTRGGECHEGLLRRVGSSGSVGRPEKEGGFEVRTSLCGYCL